MEKIRIAIVGAGGMADYHYKGFTNAGANVVAICDQNFERAESYAEKNGIPSCYSSLTELLRKSSNSIDAVSIITPNKFHCPLVLEALQAGKHVYCEKPPALNAHEMAEMKKHAEERNLCLMFDFNNRARPESQAMMEYIRSGEVGKINSAQAMWIRRAGIPGFGGWFTNKSLSGGGPVVDLPHMMDLALYFMGYPEVRSVLATTYDTFMDNPNFKGPWGIADNENGVCDVESAMHAFITFTNGACLSLRSSWAEMNEREVVSVTFQGEKAGGKVERLFGVDGFDETSIDSSCLFTFEHGNMVDRIIKHRKDETMGRVRNAENFVNVLFGREDPFNTPSEALVLMKIIDAIYTSATSHMAVEF